MPDDEPAVGDVAFMISVSTRHASCGRTALILVVLATAAVFCSGAAGAETLDQAMARAYSSNPQLLASRQELKRVDEQVALATAGWRPQASVIAGGGYIKDLRDEEEAANTSQSSFSATDGPTAVLNLQVRQPIYNFSIVPRIRQAEQAVAAQRARLLAVEQDVLLRAAAAYLEVVRTDAFLRYAVDYEHSLRDSLATTRRQFDLGLVRNSSIAEAESRLAAASAQRIQAEGALASARGAYAVVIGAVPEAVAMPDMPPGIPASLEEAVDASSSNPNLVAATYAEKSADEGVDVSFGQKLPDFSLQAQVNPNSASALAVMTMPLYNGLLDPDVRSAKTLVGQRRQELEVQRRQAQQTALSAWQDLQTARGTIESLQVQGKAARLAVEGLTREYNLGLRTVSDLLNNQLQYFRAQVDLVGAQRQMRLAAFQVLAAMGRLTARDLALPVQPYDVNKHYEKVRGAWWGSGPDLE